MRNEITKTDNQTFSLSPRNLDEAMKYAELLAKSSFVPKDFKGKPGDILVAVQMGAEMGLPPIQSLQNIAVINGRPSVWGDSALAICQNHPKYESIKENISGTGDSMVAECTIKRKGEEDYTVSFSVQDAKKAGLWGRQGPWSSYPKRMLQMRARGFALRDKFSDALKGMITREEAQDIPREMKVVQEEEVTLVSKAWASKADEITASMGGNVDQVAIIHNQNPQEVIKRIEENEDTPIVMKMVNRLYELGASEDDILVTLKVSAVEDITDDHQKALTEMGMKLRDGEI